MAPRSPISPTAIHRPQVEQESNFTCPVLSSLCRRKVTKASLYEIFPPARFFRWNTCQMSATGKTSYRYFEKWECTGSKTPPAGRLKEMTAFPVTCSSLVSAPIRPSLSRPVPTPFYIISNLFQGFLQLVAHHHHESCFSSDGKHTQEE